MKYMKYRIDWVDYSTDKYGKSRKMTVMAKSIEDALAKGYKKHPKMRMPSLSLKSV